MPPVLSVVFVLSVLFVLSVVSALVSLRWLRISPLATLASPYSSYALSFDPFRVELYGMLYLGIRSAHPEVKHASPHFAGRGAGSATLAFSPAAVPPRKVLI